MELSKKNFIEKVYFQTKFLFKHFALIYFYVMFNVLMFMHIVYFENLLGIVHIYVDSQSPQGNVYVKCPSVAVAHRSVATLHGRWFAGMIYFLLVIKSKQKFRFCWDDEFFVTYIEDIQDIWMKLL